MADDGAPAARVSNLALGNAAAQLATALVVQPAQQQAPSAVLAPGSPGRVLPPHTLSALAKALAKASARFPGEEDAPSLGLPALPFALQAEVLQRVPPDQTLLLNRVNRAFKAMVDQPELWRDVKLGAGSGVGRASDALLRAIAAKAGGTMRTLDVSGRLGRVTPSVTFDAVVAVCEANAGTLEAVDVRFEDDPGFDNSGYYFDHEDIARLLAAAPRLRWLDADVYCELADLQALLSSPNGRALRVHRLRVVDLPCAADVMVLVAVVATQSSVSQLGLSDALLHTAASLDAVVGLSFAQRLGALELDNCDLNATSLPALTRLLGSENGLRSLVVHNDQNQNDGEEEENGPLPPSPAFCAALRASALQRLVLSGVRLFDDPDAGIALLAVATGHPSLQLLGVWYNQVAVAHRAAVGTALGALVASNALSLTSLEVCDCRLGNAGLAPLVAALAGNTALRSLDIGGNDNTRPFGEALLAAVGANTGLRKLEAKQRGAELPEVAEAEALVAARA